MQLLNFKNYNSGHQANMVAVLCWALLILASGVTVKAAAFRNLGFESSSAFPPGDYSYPFTVYANALPAWTVHVDNTIQSGAWANEYVLDAPGVALMTGAANPLDGQNSVYLQSAFSAPTNFPNARARNVSISQVGLVPAGSQSLRFKSLNQWFDYFPIPPGPFDIRLGENSLSLIPTVSNGGYVEYAADVSPWAGQTLELSIGVLASPAWGNASFPEGWAHVDSIIFSPVSVPEPAASLLIGMGGLFLLRLHRQHARRGRSLLLTQPRHAVENKLTRV